MARTTEELVTEIVSVDDSIDIAPFIEVASSIVDKVESADSNSALSDEDLELIERWLAAHFYCIRDPRTSAEKAGPVSATYQSKVGTGFAVTHYGQQAMALDVTGYLKTMSSELARRKVATVTWLGTESDE